MTKYSKGSSSTIIILIVSFLLVAAGSFYFGLFYASRQNVIEARPGVSQGDVSNSNNVVESVSQIKSDISDATIAAYLNDPVRRSPGMDFKVVKPGLISAKSSEYSITDELSVKTKGDINGDGYEDLVLRTFTCGASCGNNVAFVVNDGGGGIANYLHGLPGYVSSGAGQSTIEDIVIEKEYGYIKVSMTIRSGKLMPSGEVSSVKVVKKYKYQNGIIVALSQEETHDSTAKPVYSNELYN